LSAEKGQTGNHSITKKLYFTEHRGVKTQTSHTEGFEITATPQVGILFTASPLKKQ